MQPSSPKVTRLSKAISALLVALFALQYFMPTVTNYLALVPGRWVGLSFFSSATKRAVEGEKRKS